MVRPCTKGVNVRSLSNLLTAVAIVLAIQVPFIFGVWHPTAGTAYLSAVIGLVVGLAVCAYEPYGR